MRGFMTRLSMISCASVWVNLAGLQVALEVDVKKVETRPNDIAAPSWLLTEAR